MTVQSIIVDTNPHTHSNNTDPQVGRTREGHTVTVITNIGRQSTLKGLLWGYGGIKFLGATIGASALTTYAVAGATLASAAAPDAGIALVAASLALGTITYALAKVTGSCFHNCMWHLGGPRQEVVVTRT